MPSLQDLCRVAVRRILRANIHSQHPELSNPRKRQKKPKRKRQRLPRINVVPMSMGMMVLGQFDESGDEDSESGDGMRRRRNQHLLPTGETTDDSQDPEDMLDDNEGEDEEDDEKSDDIKVEKNGSSEKEKEGDTVGPDDIDEGMEELDDSTDKEAEGTNGRAKSSVKNGFDEERLEDDEEGASDSRKEKSPSLDGKKRTGVDSTSRRTAAKSRMRAFMSPPSPTLSDDSDDIDNVDYDIAEMLRRSAVDMRQARVSRQKARCSSSTSADTSETSGIGSLSDDHIDADILGKDGSLKSSPPGEFGSLNSNESHLRRRSNHNSVGGTVNDIQPMDCSDHEEEEEEEEYAYKIVRRKKEGEEEEEGEEGEAEEEETQEKVPPRDTIRRYMREAVENLPLPQALKSYLLYYRA